MHAPAIRAGHGWHLNDLAHTQALQGLVIHHDRAASRHQHGSHKHRGREGQAVGALGGPPVERICRGQGQGRGGGGWGGVTRDRGVGGMRLVDTDGSESGQALAPSAQRGHLQVAPSTRCPALSTAPPAAHLPPPAPCLMPSWGRRWVRSRMFRGRWPHSAGRSAGRGQVRGAGQACGAGPVNYA